MKKGLFHTLVLAKKFKYRSPDPDDVDEEVVLQVQSHNSFAEPGYDVDCSRCYFHTNCLGRDKSQTGECMGDKRTDGNYVQFIKIE